jgi:hypothetical protein
MNPMSFSLWLRKFFHLFKTLWGSASRLPFSLEEKREYSETVHQLFLDFKKAYESVKREVLYNILLEFGIPRKLVRLIKICLNETCSKVHVGKHLPDTFPIQNGLK